MRRRWLMGLALGLLVLPCETSDAVQRTTELSGKVQSYSANTALLAVLTRLGLKSFLINDGTIITLNNHSGTTADLRSGDEVTVTYEFSTARAVRVRLVRENKLKGKIRTVTAAAIEVGAGAGSALSLRVNTSSKINLDGIVLTDRSVLVGIPATAIYEPGTLTLLSLRGTATVFSGRISAIDVANRRVTLVNRATRVITLDSRATLQRNGTAAAIGDLVVGDLVRASYVNDGTVFRGFAAEANN